MKIVYFNYLWDLYGAALGSTIKALRLMEAIEARGHQVEIYWRNAAPEQAGTGASGNTLRIAIKKALAKILHEPHQAWKNLRYYREECGILATQKPDILVSRLDKYVVTAPYLKSKFNLPLVVEADAPVAYEFRRYHPEYWKAPRFLEALERKTLRAADAVITVSDEIADYLYRYGLAEERIHVVPNAADVRRFNPSVPGEPVRRKYGLENRIVIGFIGSFHHWHGVDSLWWLIDRICAAFPEAAFLLVGAGGPRAGELAERVRSRGLAERVVMPGVIRHESMPEYVAAMDIVLAPYPPMEFFYYSPVKVYEYMACGKAVVASSLGQIRQLIRDGYNGFLCPPGDLEGFAARIADLVSDAGLREAIGKRAFETIRADHTWDHRAREWVRILETVLENHRKGHQ